MTTSPMMRQYEEAKAACGDAILLFRMGDFYELFYEDAKTVARVLGLTLTSRDKGENPIPMAGFPFHQLDGYLAKLIRQGFRVAVCEQVEDPKLAKGLVRREIQRIVTAGTLTEDALLDPHASNYLAAICLDASRGTKPSERAGNESAGLAWVDLSTGRFEGGVFSRKSLPDQLARIGPTEVLVREDQTPMERPDSSTWTVTKLPAWQFGFDEARRLLCEQFGVRDLSGLGWEEGDALALAAAGAILAYLKETQKTSLSHITSLTPARAGHFLEIDSATRRSLELTQTMRTGGRDGTLLSVIDQTVTAMGARRVAYWLTVPLIQRTQIEARLDAVQEFVSDAKWRDQIRQQLREVFDLERLLARIATGRANPRDLKSIAQTLRQFPGIAERLQGRNSSRIQELASQFQCCDELRIELERALNDDCPINVRDGGFIRPGYDPQLDELRSLASGGKEWIAHYQAEQIESTGIPSLKVGFNSVFGYYLEVTNTHRDKIPANFIRKQTLKNAERYITPELKEYEEKVLTADEQSKQLEVEIFQKLRGAVYAQTISLQRSAAVLSELDALAGFAELAVKRNYVRPVITEEPIVEIREGRHPVLDLTMPQGEFVPNDIMIGSEHGCVLLITGPNMAGKSTYIRQVALLTLMAQLGSFVPARQATVGIADRIFARVGANDELSRGQSTFMVEMVETARILNTATPNSLIILDEIGRGTSTYDGLSLAWAIVEFLHDTVRARTLFATHYHELIELEKSLPGVKNYNVAVKEWNDDVIFLHRIVRGGADRSYGIQVARMAGVPASVNERAKDILAQLEVDHINKYGESKITPPKRKPNAPLQLTLFEWNEHPLLDRIRSFDLHTSTPLEALRTIELWQQELLGSPPQPDKPLT